MSNCYKYYEFNKKVYEEFFKENLHSNHHAAVIFSDITKVKTFDEFEGACQYLGGKTKTWQDLVKYDVNGIPEYLGIIALQIYALSLRMSNSDEHPKGAYNPELRKLLGGITQQKLNNLYCNAQKAVFTEFETWCQKNGVGIKYFINSGRPYVSYPLSFPILHKGDCNKLKNIFGGESLPVDGDYEFDDFCDSLRRPVSKIFPELSENDEFSQALWLQIYLFYKNWDGTYTAADQKNSVSKKNQEKQIEYYIDWNISEEKSPSSYSNRDEIVKLLNKYENKGCFFVKSPYNFEWHFVLPPDIDLTVADPESGDDCDYYLYIYKKSKTTEISTKLSQCKCKLEYPDSIPLPVVDEFDCYILNSKEIKEHLEDCLSDIKIRLHRGIKVKPWSQIWLEGAGPVIDAPDDFAGKVTLIHCGNSQKVEYFSPSEQRLIDLALGAYKLRYSADPDDIIYFEIGKADDFRKTPLDEVGWKIDANSLQVAEENRDIHIRGLDFSGIPEELLENNLIKPGNPCRIWMDLAATGKSPEYSNENLIHKSLRRAKNGLRIR